MLVYFVSNKSEDHLISHGFRTRYATGSYLLPRMAKTVCQRCFTFLAPRAFNMLPLRLRNLVSINLFKKKVKKWLLSNPRSLMLSMVDIKNAPIR
ncbi:hypothetical protein HHI36_005463 [Cryptolaemus montrouzieri]|uniref:Uncharacterized protein n=1 Tax=Cryptolaemus montrouzieri TaxID=559131 RepID=A0ABD2NUP3_9CUCU